MPLLIRKNNKSGNVIKFIIKKLYGGKLSDVNKPNKKGIIYIKSLWDNIDFNFFCKNNLILNFLFYSFFENFLIFYDHAQVNVSTHVSTFYQIL